MTRFSRRNIQNETENAFDIKVTAMTKRIDIYVQFFGLDPSLPEVLDLKASTRDILAGEIGDSEMSVNLGRLNPYPSTHTEGRVRVIEERMLGHLLNPWTLAEFHVGKPILGICTRIRVDGTGTHMFDENGTEYAHYKAGVLNPNRFVDEGNRVLNAMLFVEHFTGLKLVLEDVWTLFWIEFSKNESGVWDISLGNKRPIAA